MVVIGKTVYRIASIASSHLGYKISLSKLVLNSRDKQKKLRTSKHDILHWRKADRNTLLKLVITLN